MSEATCEICNWTNTGCLNLGNPNEEPKWVCHGCIKREFDKLAELERDLVHVFAGNHRGCQGALIRSDKKDTFLGRLISARKASKYGDIWLTPHWC